MPWNFEQVAGPFDFTEGPAWDGEALFFTDIPNSRILRYDPQNGETSVYRTGTNEANGLMFDKDGQLYACEGGDGVTFPQGGAELHDRRPPHGPLPKRWHHHRHLRSVRGQKAQ